MKFIKINDHLYDIIQGWESELEIEYFIPCGVLILPNAKALEFCKGEVVSPPIAFLL